MQLSLHVLLAISLYHACLLWLSIWFLSNHLVASLFLLLQLKALSVLQRSGPITPVDPNCGSKGVLSDRKKDFIRKRVLQGLAASDSPGKTCVIAYAIQSRYVILLCAVSIRF